MCNLMWCVYVFQLDIWKDAAPTKMWRGKTRLEVDSLTQGDPEGQWTSWLQRFSYRLTGTSLKTQLSRKKVWLSFHYPHFPSFWNIQRGVQCVFFVSFSTDVESWNKKLDRPHWAVLTLNEVRILLCTFKKLLCLVSGFNKKQFCRTNFLTKKQKKKPASQNIGEKSEKRWVVISITTTCFIPLQSCFQLLHAIQLTWYQ